MAFCSNVGSHTVSQSKFRQKSHVSYRWRPSPAPLLWFCNRRTFLVEHETNKNNHQRSIIFAEYTKSEYIHGCLFSYNFLPTGETLIQVNVRDNEPFEKAMRRFRRKVEREGIRKDIKKNSFYLKPGEKRRLKQRLAEKRRRKAMRRAQRRR